jgi:hypothetical protein
VRAFGFGFDGEVLPGRRPPAHGVVVVGGLGVAARAKGTFYLFDGAFPA